MSGRILYLQYTNPAALPPLERSSRILAARGWQVLFVGTGAQGADRLCLPSHPHIAVRQMQFHPGGWRQKLHYLRYCAWAFGWAMRWRPGWIYVSDPLACPAALLLRRMPGVHLIYHEHDSPGEAQPGSAFQRLVLHARREVARRATLCILPNQQRLERFVSVTSVDPQRTLCVWNCPSLDEVAQIRTAQPGTPLTLYYHGSIGPHRLPEVVLTALTTLPDFVRLKIIGYETVGSQGYLQFLMQRADELDISQRLSIIGTVPTRKDLLEYCRQADIGLAFMPKMSPEINEQTMFSGPSNKTFDYLASGLALAISDHNPDWNVMYIDPGYGLACNADDSRSIADTLHWFLDHPEEMRAMGERGRQHILAEWNYEQQFSPVLDVLKRGV